MPECAHCGEEYPAPGPYKSHVLTCANENGAVPADEPIEESDAQSGPEGASGPRARASESNPGTEAEAGGTIDQQVERVVDDRLETLEDDLEQLSDDIDELENFATISLGERRLDQAEANLSEFSQSLTELSERALEQVNNLESRLEFQTVVLATALDALADADVDIDTEPIRAYQQEQIVTEQSPSQRLEDAIENLES
ncbi:hypothetical protein [Natronococcus occultus]|uniref:Uncharacterized protein n=1 Tax=Natronococcus occultus SP4 TaxID=694430 RepID=L0JWY5_9EURY|nr:hypothetical protein [Natronococcus occultus]AGB37557.1 hypothetical protein Natoc_1758 [Natronococcus occultus SP4]